MEKVLPLTLFMLSVLLLFEESQLAVVKDDLQIHIDEFKIFDRALMEPVSCINPNGRPGTCISLDECEPLKYVVRIHLVRRYDFVRLSQCPGRSGIYPMVCCTPDTRFSNLQAKDFRIIFPDN